MVKCKKCGHTNDDRGKFCGVCGAKLKKPKNHELDSFTQGFKAVAPPKKKNKWSF